MNFNPAIRLPVNSKHSLHLNSHCYGYYRMVWCSLTSHQWGYLVDSFQLFSYLFFPNSFTVCCLFSQSPSLAAYNTNCCSAPSYLSLVSQAVMRRMGFTFVGWCSTWKFLQLQQGPDCLSSLPPRCLVSFSAPSHPYSYLDLSGNAYRLLLDCCGGWFNLLMEIVSVQCLAPCLFSMPLSVGYVGAYLQVCCCCLLSPSPPYIYIYKYIQYIYSLCISSYLVLSAVFMLVYEEVPAI